jgi:molybdate transport repressor ModE-like protein
MKVKVKVWFEQDGEYVFGDGRAELLRLIGHFGSIREAAAALKMSYRHAWGQIRKMEERLGVKFVESRTGGRGGGKTNLTRAAIECLDRYDKFRHDLDVFVQEESSRELRNICFW